MLTRKLPEYLKSPAEKAGKGILIRKSAALLLCLAMLLTGIASAAAEGQDLPAAAETEETGITLAYEAGWPNRSMAADTCSTLRGIFPAGGEGIINAFC